VKLPDGRELQLKDLGASDAFLDVHHYANGEGTGMAFLKECRFQHAVLKRVSGK
jgi:hypothetical protein